MNHALKSVSNPEKSSKQEWSGKFVSRDGMISDSNHDGLSGAPKRMAQMLGLATAHDEVSWRADELRAMLHYQFAQPLPNPSANNGSKRNRDDKGHPDAAGIVCLECFHDLFVHPSPPLALLKFAKDYARASRMNPVDGLPEKVAGVLYYLSIAAAMVRCQTRITALPTAKLERGFNKLIEESWVDGRFKPLLVEAAKQCRAEVANGSIPQL